MADEPLGRDSIELIVIKTLDVYNGRLDPRLNKLEVSHAEIRNQLARLAGDGNGDPGSVARANHNINQLRNEAVLAADGATKARAKIADDLVEAKGLVEQNRLNQEKTVELLCKRLDVVEEDRKDNKQQWLLLKWLTACTLAIPKFWRFSLGFSGVFLSALKAYEILKDHHILFK